MRSCLMVGVMPCMLDGLRLRQTADDEHAEHEENRQDLQEGWAHHKIPSPSPIKSSNKY